MDVANTPLYEIYHVQFESQYKLTSTLLRFQEHYESPRFRGEVFDLETFMDWYVTSTTHGYFSYLEDWAGFNFPSRIFEKFRGGSFDPLTRKEQKFLEMFKGLNHEFYVIATAGETEKSTSIIHEIVHGLFHTDTTYRDQVLGVLAGCELSAFANAFKDLGYHDEVLLDECMRTS